MASGPFRVVVVIVPRPSFPAASIDPTSVERSLPVLLVLFAGSGCAALIYQVAWLQMLELVIGSSAVSLAVLLGTFMGGMGLGNLALPRLVPPAWHPLRVYAVLELGIGLGAIVVLAVMPTAGGLYLEWAAEGHAGIGWRAAVGVGCLLPATMLMGATLPAIARWTSATPRGISWLGFFYAGNTVGAVAGCLLAGFYLLRVHDMVVATWCAVGINAAVGLVAFALASVCGVRSSGREPERVPVLRLEPGGRAAVAGSIAVSGFCAMGAEVIWTRLLSLMLGATVYTFAIILAVFLAGLGLGSFVGAAIARRSARPRFALGWCQLLQIGAIAWASDMLTSTLPFWQGHRSPDSSVWLLFQSDLIRSGCALLPAACLWGASFPLALAAGTPSSGDPGRGVSLIYAANTAGAIAGAVLTSLVLLPLLGTGQVQALLIVLSTAGALLVLRPANAAGWGAVAAGIGLAFWLSATSPAVPWQLVTYGRHAPNGDPSASILYLGEGANATVAVSQTRDGARYFHVSGKTEASSLFKDMRLQRLLGHLPALLHERPRSVLVVGCGAGVTAGSFVLHPSVERIVICEIEPLIPPNVTPHFREENHGVLDDPRVEVVYDDARHFLATTHEKFDVITSDPIHPWVKGAAMLYSAEYFSLCRAHLNPGGLVTQWVPFYHSSPAVVRSEIATFLTAFPHATIWGNDDEGRGYDSVLLGPVAPLAIDIGALERRLNRPDHAAVRLSLAEVGLGSSIDLLMTFAGYGPDLSGWLKHAEINRDRSLRLQYLAGLAFNSSTGQAAYGEMLGYRRLSGEVFLAGHPFVEELRRRMPLPPGRQ
ncbi:MAG: fused MFS/spermidine synthase [Opitutus sp.]